MASPANHWKLGLFVLGTLAVLFAILAWLGAKRLDRDTFPMSTFFDEPVTGLAVGAPVYFRGMQIGQVSEIRSATEGSRWIRVDAQIDAEALFRIGLRRPETFDKTDPQVPPEVRARLERSIVTGVATIQTDYYALDESEVPDYEGFEPPVNTIHSVPSPSTTFEAGLNAVLASLPTALDNAASLFKRIEDELAAADIPALAQHLGELIARLDHAISEDELDEAGEAIAEFRGVMAEIRDAFRSMRTLTDGLQAEDGDLSGTLGSARRLLDALDDMVGGLDLAEPMRSTTAAADGVTDLTTDLRDVVPELRRTLQQLQSLVELLERDPGALLHGRQPTTDPRRR